MLIDMTASAMEKKLKNRYREESNSKVRRWAISSSLNSSDSNIEWFVTTLTSSDTNMTLWTSGNPITVTSNGVDVPVKLNCPFTLTANVQWDWNKDCSIVNVD